MTSHGRDIMINVGLRDGAVDEVDTVTSHDDDPVVRVVRLPFEAVYDRTARKDGHLMVDAGSRWRLLELAEIVVQVLPADTDDDHWQHVILRRHPGMWGAAALYPDRVVLLGRGGMRMELRPLTTATIRMLSYYPAAARCWLDVHDAQRLLPEIFTITLPDLHVATHPVQATVSASWHA